MTGFGYGPPITWIHALHQVTGLFAIRGNKMTAKDKTEVKTILERLLREMEIDDNWRSRDDRN